MSVAIRRGGFFDRGDVIALDFELGDLTVDNGWHDLDLSSIVAYGAKAVLLKLEGENSAVSGEMLIKKKGNTYYTNAGVFRLAEANLEHAEDVIVPLSSDRMVEYSVANVGVWDTLSIHVKGWWL